MTAVESDKDQNNADRKGRLIRSPVTLLLVFASIVLFVASVDVFYTWLRNGTVEFSHVEEKKILAQKFPHIRKGSKRRYIGTVTANFPPHRYLRRRTYMVESNSIRLSGTGGSSLGVSRYPKYRIWDTKSVSFILFDEKVDSESDPLLRYVSIMGSGLPRNTGGTVAYRSYKNQSSQTFVGEIEPKIPYLLYVEGDREFVAHREMTIKEFLEQNDGRFIVVTIELD